jgi:hypothetical protein
LSQGRGRSLIQWKQHTNFTLIMQKWLDSVWEQWGPVKRLNTGFATVGVLWSQAKKMRNHGLIKDRWELVAQHMLKWRRTKKRKIWYFDRIGEAHNHKLQPSARMHAHKQREAAMDDLFAIMSRSGVPNQAAMNVMSELYGGRQNWPFTEKDIQNM